MEPHFIIKVSGQPWYIHDKKWMTCENWQAKKFETEKEALRFLNHHVPPFGQMRYTIIGIEGEGNKQGA